MSDARYYEIRYRHNDQDLYARVGEPDPLNGETVLAIFKPKHAQSPFLVCTYIWGFLQGQPILASSDAQAVEWPGNYSATRCILSASCDQVISSSRRSNEPQYALPSDVGNIPLVPIDVCFWGISGHRPNFAGCRPLTLSGHLRARRNVRFWG